MVTKEEKYKNKNCLFLLYPITPPLIVTELLLDRDGKPNLVINYAGTYLNKTTGIMGEIPLLYCYRRQQVLAMTFI